MLRDLDGAFGDIYSRRRLLHAFEAGWAREQSEHPGLALAEEDLTFEAQVIHWLRHHDAMLIGEVVPIAYDYLKNSPLAPERTQFRHVIVDEYQDLNRLEQEVVNFLRGPDASICVAGDDDQSIYRFRHAHPQGIRDFVADPATESKSILACGRCPQVTVDVANSLMHSAPGRDKADLICTHENGGTLAIVQWHDLAEEVDGLVSAIVGDISAERREPGDFLVLVNRREVGYRIRTALVSQGITAHSYFQDNALKKSAVAQEALAGLRLLVFPGDRPALRVWLGLGESSARATAYNELRRIATTVGVREFEVLVRTVDGADYPVSRGLANRFKDLQLRLDLVAGLKVSDLVEYLFPSGNQDMELMRELAKEALATASTSAELLERMLHSITQPEVPQSPDFVRVMSLHKSKGLTSPVVFVATAIDGVLPTIDADNSEEEQELDRQEGRRLFYVALTRSGDELVISHPAQMLSKDAFGMAAGWGKLWREDGELMASCLPTPYLKELGEKQPAAVSGVEWLGSRG